MRLDLQHALAPSEHQMNVRTLQIYQGPHLARLPPFTARGPILREMQIPPPAGLLTLALLAPSPTPAMATTDQPAAPTALRLSLAEELVAASRESSLPLLPSKFSG